MCVADQVPTSQQSCALTSSSAVSSAASTDTSLLQLIDKLGLAKYAGVFIDQEASVVVLEEDL